MKKALICGITGQDGSYLTELLIARGYQVRGIVRRTSPFNTDRLDHIYSDPHEEHVPLKLHFGCGETIHFRMRARRYVHV